MHVYTSAEFGSTTLTRRYILHDLLSCLTSPSRSATQRAFRPAFAPFTVRPSLAFHYTSLSVNHFTAAALPTKGMQDST